MTLTKLSRRYIALESLHVITIRAINKTGLKREGKAARALFKLLLDMDRQQKMIMVAKRVTLQLGQ